MRIVINNYCTHFSTLIYGLLKLWLFRIKILYSIVFPLISCFLFSRRLSIRSYTMTMLPCTTFSFTSGRKVNCRSSPLWVWEVTTVPGPSLPPPYPRSAYRASEHYLIPQDYQYHNGRHWPPICPRHNPQTVTWTITSNDTWTWAADTPWALLTTWCSYHKTTCADYAR